MAPGCRESLEPRWHHVEIFDAHVGEGPGPETNQGSPQPDQPICNAVPLGRQSDAKPSPGREKERDTALRMRQDEKKKLECDDLLNAHYLLRDRGRGVVWEKRKKSHDAVSPPVAREARWLGVRRDGRFDICLLCRRLPGQSHRGERPLGQDRSLAEPGWHGKDPCGVWPGVGGPAPLPTMHSQPRSFFLVAALSSDHD